MFPVFLFLTRHLLKFEHKSTDKRRMETFCLLTTYGEKYIFIVLYILHICFDILLFIFRFIFSIVESSFQQFKKESIDDY